MEARRDGYKNTVKSVARELMGPKFIADLKDDRWGFWKSSLPFYRTYLPLFHQGITGTDPARGDFLYYCYNVIKPVEESAHAHKGTFYATEGVSWTFAAAILAGDEIINGLSPVHQRYIFDAALGVGLSDYTDRYQTVTRRAAHAAEVAERSRLEAAADDWSKTAGQFESFQHKLRELVEKPAQDGLPARRRSRQRVAM